MSIRYRCHIENISWTDYAQDGIACGTVEQALRLEAIQVILAGMEDLSIGVEYQAHVENYGWMPIVSNGETAGTVGEGLRLEAIRMRLTGQDASKYSLQYRVYVEDIGWVLWSKDWETSGTEKMALRAEAIEIRLVPNQIEIDKVIPTTPIIQSVATEDSLAASYSTHIQDYGWMPSVYGGMMSGTVGKSLRMEAMRITLVNTGALDLGIEYQGHIQNEGWQETKSDGETAGTTDFGLRMEAVKIRLTGADAPQYSVWYRVHIEGHGWSEYAKDWEISGTVDSALRAEAIEIVIAKAGANLIREPGQTHGVSTEYCTHLENMGWTGWVKNGTVSGTTGRALRMEAFKLKINKSYLEGVDLDVQYRAHVENIGWMAWVDGGEIAGTEGQGVRLEAFEIVLIGIDANDYSIQYRVHLEDLGWSEWYSDGETAGTVSEGRRAEAVSIVIIKKTNLETEITNEVKNKAPYIQVYGQEFPHEAFLLHDIRTELKLVEEIELVEGVNAVPSLTFSIPPGHPHYDDLHDLRTTIQVYEVTSNASKNQIFEGRILNSQSDKNNVKKVVCEGELAYLLDSIQRPATYEDLTIEDYLTTLLNNHNMNVTADKRIYMGICTVTVDGTALGALSTNYRTHIENEGWLDSVQNGKVSGTVGSGLRMEAFELVLGNSSGLDLGVTYRAHLADSGWGAWVTDGQTVGTVGEWIRLEALEIKLTGAAADKYCIQYRVHVEDEGWMPWKADGETAGTEGESLRAEAISVIIIERGATSNLRQSLFRQNDYVKTFDLLKTSVTDVYGGYLVIEHVGGYRFLDYINNYQVVNTQPIEFAKNLLDINKSSYSESLITGLIPLGAKLEDGSDNRLTIASANSNSDYIFDAGAVNLRGWIFDTVIFEDIINPSILLQKGIEYLNKVVNSARVSVTVDALDLSIINADIEKMLIGDSVRVLSKPHGIDTFLPVTKKTTKLLNIGSSNITFGGEQPSLTSYVSGNMGGGSSNGYTNNLTDTKYLDQKISDLMFLIQTTNDEASYTMVDVIAHSGAIPNGTTLRTIGFFDVDDGGAATYRIEGTEYKWSIKLSGEKFANIQEKEFVNYKMFGARLDLTVDDTPAIKKCHQYADSIYELDTNRCKVFTCTVRNHHGYIRISNSIYCSGNVDLSGSTIIIDDSSATWFGAYVWGQNASEYYTLNNNETMRASMKEGVFRLEGTEAIPDNTVLHLVETHYEIRDDDGYLYDVDKAELMVHQQGGIFSTALGSDWTDAGGTIVHAETEDKFLTTELAMSYTYLPTQHRTFKGCRVMFEGSADNYCSVIWIKGHNCTVEDFTFYPTEGTSSNALFKNTMMYVWGSYKVTIRNCIGFNAAGKISAEVPTPTSGYVIRGFQTCDLVIEDCDLVGIWGSITVSSSKNVHINKTKANRIDVHDYIINLFVTQCIVYHHALQIGSGGGMCSVTDTIFYNQFLPEERYPGSHLIALQVGYGRVFSGKIFIQNCKYVYKLDGTGKQFYFVTVSFSPNCRSIEKSYKFPEITIKDFTFDSVDKDDVFMSVLNASGGVKRTTSTIEPLVTAHVSYSGETKWVKHALTKDFYDGDYLVTGELIRKVTRGINSKGKVEFFNIEYYQVIENGNYYINPEPPPTEEELAEMLENGEVYEEQKPLTDLRRLYAPYYLPGAPYSTTADSDFVVARGSKFFPEEVFTGNIGLKSDGNYPNHKSGVAWVGDSEYMEGMYLQYDESNVVIPEWEPNMEVSRGQYYTLDAKLFLVVQEGVTLGMPLESPEWLAETAYGTARVIMIGSLWVPGIWLPEGGIALTYTTPGYNGSDFTYEKYTAVQREGRGIGDNLVVSSGLLLDGGIIWRRNIGAAVSGNWAPNTEYAVGSIININGVPHTCEYVQEVDMPQRMTLSNITHTSTAKPYFFSFDSAMDIKTKNTLKVVVDDIADFRGISYNNVPFFGLTANPQQNVVQIEGGSSGSVDLSALQAAVNSLTSRVQALEGEVIYSTFTFTKGTARWLQQNVNKNSQQIVGKLEITNNNTFEVYYNVYESYNYGSFSWTELKSILLQPSQKATEYIQLSGTRNDFIIQTRSASAAIEAPNSIITLKFSSWTNVTTPTLICP
ncbi:phage tail spike protein [Eubacteriaceae bacterium ES2]|nr:phage tail spike protein [Eubacteriaceae bacterium ES2]